VARDEDAILRRHEVRLDEIGAELDAERVILERVVGKIPGGAAAMADDERRGLALAPAAVGGDGSRETGDAQQRERRSLDERKYFSWQSSPMGFAQPAPVPTPPYAESDTLQTEAQQPHDNEETPQCRTIAGYS
jgi:hypothetical protein